MDPIKQAIIDIGDTPYYKKLYSELKFARTVLDVGCGARSPIQKIKRPFRSTGIDIFTPSITASKKAGIHDEYVTGNVLDLRKHFKKKSFDAVIALDLIEHIEKKDGLRLLSMMEDIAREKVVLLTPNGYVNQDPYEDNPYQVHKSGWSRDEFESAGYRVYGMRGLKHLRGECATLKYRPWILWGSVSVASEPIVYFFPQYANQLFAVKQLHNV